MRINLHEIIDVPGGVVPFNCKLETDRLCFPAISRFLSEPTASGRIENRAGILTLTGELNADMICICDRCASEFEWKKTQALHVQLAAELEDEENPDIFLLEDDCLDLDDVLETCFILDMETKCLCKEDCAGLCSSCGANLNTGECSCRKKVDPRFAVLEQLLDKES